MRLFSIRWKLTLLYVATVTAFLVVFVGADVIGLKHNLMQQAEATGLSAQAMYDTWVRALWEHVIMAAGLIVVVVGLGYAFVVRTLRPVRDMARTAREISAEDLNLRVDAHGDRDELGELAQTLNDMIAGLETSFARIKRFSADVAHELSTPLTVLHGELELALAKERSNEDYRKTIGHLLGEVNGLSAIVDNLMFLSRVEAGNIKVSGDSQALNTIVMTVYEEAITLAEQRKVQIDLERIDPVNVSGDGLMLKRMCANIVQNAIKYNRRGGRIRIDLARDGQRFECRVSDNGVGIPAEDLPRLFDRFYRVEKSRSKQTGGAGLGLAIVREIAELHGMTVSIESEPEVGTVVCVNGDLLDDGAI